MESTRAKQERFHHMASRHFFSKKTMVLHMESHDLSRRRQRRRQQHQQQQQGSNDGGALDVPPPVVLPFHGQPAKLVLRTARPLASARIQTTGIDSKNASPFASFSNCNPIIAFEKYIVSAALTTTTTTTDTRDPQVCFHQLLSLSTPSSSSSLISEEAKSANEPSCKISPVITIPLTGSPIVALVTMVCVRKDENTLLGHVVTLSSDGMVHVMECRNDDNNNDTPSVALVASWQTGSHPRTTASSIAVPQTNSGEFLPLVVGFQSGGIEYWKLSLRRSDPGNDSVVEKFQTKLVWRGMMEQPVTALHLFLQRQIATAKTPATLDANDQSLEDLATHEDESEGNNNNNNNNNAFDQQKYQQQYPRDLQVVCLQQTTTFLETSDPLSTPRSSGLLQVIDLNAVEDAWTALTHTKEGTEEPLTLSTFLVEPLEEKDEERDSLEPIPSNEIHQLLWSGNYSKSGAASSDHSFLCCLNDGSQCAVVLGHNKAIAMLQTTTSSLSSWCLAKKFYPHFLTYPAIGCGVLECSSSSSTAVFSQQANQQQHLACCLRGGTVYLLPTTHHYTENKNINKNNNNHAVTVFTFPHELDLDLEARFLQGFTAGMLQVKGESDSTKHQDSVVREPVLVYAWPGGFLDVFSCRLMTGASAASSVKQGLPNAERQILQELINNGSLHLLHKLLESLDSIDPLLQQPLWQEAKAEVVSCSDLTMDLLKSQDFQSLRRLLLQQAETNE